MEHELNEDTLDHLLDKFRDLRKEHEGRMSEPVRKLYERIRKQVWVETTPDNDPFIVE